MKDSIKPCICPPNRKEKLEVQRIVIVHPRQAAKNAKDIDLMRNARDNKRVAMKGMGKASESKIGKLRVRHGEPFEEEEEEEEEEDVVRRRRPRLYQRTSKPALSARG